MFSRLLLPLCGLGLCLMSGCGPAYPADEGDEFYGTIDASALDAKLAPATGSRCPAGVSRCYPAQQVSVSGTTIALYNLGAVTTGLTFGTDGTLPASRVASAPYGYDFPTACDAREANELQGYPNDSQFPIFSALPLAPSSSSTIVLPFVRTLGVSGLSGNPCNALKRATSVEDGQYGAVPAEATTATPRLWAVIDPSALVVPLSPTSAFRAGFGWYKGLLLSYLDGGPLPLDASGNVITMDGVLVSPSSGTASNPTDTKVVILPAAPGDSGYSPVLRLHRFTAAVGSAPSSYTQLCSSGGDPLLPLCSGAANEVDMELVSPTVSHTVFIASSTL